MNVEKVESLLERSRPAPPPPDLRRRIQEAADRKFPSLPVSPRKPRWLEVMTVAASVLMLIATVSWLLRVTPPAPPTVGSQESGQPFVEKRIADNVPATGMTNFTWSADGKHWACVLPGGFEELSCVIVDGKRDAGYHRVDPPRFGADGSYAYLVNIDPVSGKQFVLNGVLQTQFTNYDQFSWSPDGKGLAYVAANDKQIFVVRDGERSGPYTHAGELRWSADGRALGFAAALGKDWFCVVDGKKGEPFDKVHHVTFSPEGRTVAYAANEGSWMVVVGDKKWAEHVSVGRPVFSPNGSAVGYFASSESEAFVVVNVLAPAHQFVRSQGFETAGSPVFSRDGKAWAFRAKAKDSKKELVVVNREVRLQAGGAPRRGEENGTLYDSVSDPVVNSDGSLVAYAAGKGSRRYLVVGEERTLKFSRIDRISFGPDGRTVAFRAEQYGKQFVVAGESRSNESDEIVSGPVWSADGKKVAFTARNGAELWSRVLDVK